MTDTVTAPHPRGGKPLEIAASAWAHWRKIAAALHPGGDVEAAAARLAHAHAARAR